MVIDLMSQILAQRPQGHVLYSDLTFPKQKIQLKSSVQEAICKYCKSEILEGNGLSAKWIDGKMALVCGNHKF